MSSRTPPRGSIRRSSTSKRSPGCPCRAPRILRNSPTHSRRLRVRCVRRARAREAVEKEIDETTGRLAQLAAGRPLATADRIAEARARRETAWLPLRAAIFGAPEAPPQASLAAHVAEFERLKGEADRLTDDAIEDAARLARHGLETQRLDEQTRRYALAQAAEARAAATFAETDERWRELWKHSLHPSPFASTDAGMVWPDRAIPENARQARRAANRARSRRKPSSRASSQCCAPSASRPD